MMVHLIDCDIMSSRTLHPSVIGDLVDFVNNVKNVTATSILNPKWAFSVLAINIMFHRRQTAV